MPKKPHLTPPEVSIEIAESELKQIVADFAPKMREYQVHAARALQLGETVWGHKLKERFPTASIETLVPVATIVAQENPERAEALFEKLAAHLGAEVEVKKIVVNPIQHTFTLFIRSTDALT